MTSGKLRRDSSTDTYWPRVLPTQKRDLESASSPNGRLIRPSHMASYYATVQTARNTRVGKRNKLSRDPETATSDDFCLHSKYQVE